MPVAVFKKRDVLQLEGRPGVTIYVKANWTITLADVRAFAALFEREVWPQLASSAILGQKRCEDAPKQYAQSATDATFFGASFLECDASPNRFKDNKQRIAGTALPGN